MKTLVKYIDPSTELTVYCRGFKSVSISAARLLLAGLGDNTVEGHKVGVSKDQYERHIRPILPLLPKNFSEIP